MQFSDIPRNPDPKTLRQFAALSFVIFNGVALTRYLRHGISMPVYGFAALGVLLGLAGLVNLRLLRPIFVGWMIAVFPIGWAVSHLILALVYYLCLLPIGLLLRAFHRDRLRLRRGQSGSYWLEKPQRTDPAHYFRQF